MQLYFISVAIRNYRLINLKFKEIMDKKETILRYFKTYRDIHNKYILSDEEATTIVINLAYREVLDNRKKGIDGTEELVFLNYYGGLTEILPNMERFVTMYPGYVATLQWDGIQDFLREYFLSKFDEKIDDEDYDQMSFFSSRHKRYENDILVSDDYANRKVSFIFTSNQDSCLIGINPTLSEKKTYRTEINGNQHVYVGSDPDFKFIIHYDIYDNIEHFTFIRTDRNLRFEYFE